MATLSNDAWQAKQEAAERREYERLLNEIVILEDFLGVPPSEGLNFTQARRRLANLQSVAAARMPDPDDPSEQGQTEPIYLNEREAQ